MRSLLFVPGDSPSKLEKALASPADALIIDLEDSVATERKAHARLVARGFLEQAHGLPQRPSLVIRVNALNSGLTDADLKDVLAGRPDAVLLPKAEGARSVVGLDAKLTAFEAIYGIIEGATRILALATETASSLFLAGTYRDASSRLVGLSWGAEDLSVELGAETNRGPD
ncbi:MAG: CoA ester lyase, partial [Verrucomicrobia bacterium]|nr:CoA ester lyase [Verrucomicrobiota bacterium]